MAEKSKLSSIIKMRSFEDLYSNKLPGGDQAVSGVNKVSEEKSEEPEESIKIAQISIESLVPFTENPFKLYSGQKLEDMIESIKENGVITPIVVRRMDNEKYEILSGHNRANAAKLAGLNIVPAIIKENISDANARIIVTDTNFMQRSIADMLPSEMARALKMQLEACKEAKKKQKLINEVENDSNLDQIKGSTQGTPLVHPGKSVQMMAENNGMNRENIRRYIRLNSLIPALLDRVDEGLISLRPAVDLSYIKDREQKLVAKILEENNFKVDMKKAELLHSLSGSGELDEDKLFEILSGEYNKKKKRDISVVRNSIKIPFKRFSIFFERGIDEETIVEELFRAMELYRKAR